MEECQENTTQNKNTHEIHMDMTIRQRIMCIYCFILGDNLYANK